MTSFVGEHCGKLLALSHRKKNSSGFQWKVVKSYICVCRKIIAQYYGMELTHLLFECFYNTFVFISEN